MAEEKTLLDYETLQEVKQNFTLAELVQMAKNESFGEWLAVHFYAGEAQEILDAVENQGSDAEIALSICKVFKFEFNELTPEEIAQVSAFVNQDHARELFDGRIDNKKSAVVSTQGELFKAIWGGAEVLYLYSGEFKIPLEVPNKTYIGYNHALIEILYPNNLDLDAQNITLANLQVYLRSNINVKMDNSKNVRLINGAKKTLGELGLQEVFDVMRGRSHFESSEKFKERAENVKGVAVGSVLLVDTDYNFDNQQFKVNPEWDFDYISVLKSSVDNRSFHIKLSPEGAQSLYSSERKLQIFADFTFVDERLTIAQVYLETQAAGRIVLES